VLTHLGCISENGSPGGHLRTIAEPERTGVLPHLKKNRLIDRACFSLTSYTYVYLVQSHQFVQPLILEKAVLDRGWKI
jgi:hypothetical protein